MCQRLNSRPMQLLSAGDFHFPSSGYQKHSPKASTPSCDMVYDAWLASRVMPRRKGAYLVAGAQRPLTGGNSRLAYTISKECAFDLLMHLWSLHPVRTTLMMSLNILRGLFPAFRGYSQAMIIDEVRSYTSNYYPAKNRTFIVFLFSQLQSLIASGRFTWGRLLRLMATEISRRVLESLVESFAYVNTY